MRLAAVLLAAVLGALPAAGKSAAPGAAPEQVRLSWSEDPRRSMTVMWQTAAPVESPQVEYGERGARGYVAAARRVTYAYATGVLYEAVLRDLQPGTTYHYRVGDRNGSRTPFYQFRTAPAEREDFFFTAFGDHGTREPSRLNVERVAEEQPAFHLVMGDLSYANGRQPVWDTWFRLIEPMTSSIPMMTALGNHENERIEMQPIGYVAYLARLAMPAPERWYHFDYCGARFVSFNSDDYRNPEQLAWFEQTLQASRRDPAVRWLIVFMHHPLYSSNVRRLNNTGLIETIRGLLDEHRVDLVLHGHNHNYERSYPLRGHEPAVERQFRYRKGQGPIFVVSGGGGANLYDFVPEMPVITAYREKMNHYLRVRVPVEGPLAVEAVRTEDGAVRDRFQIADGAGSDRLP